jgi:hypothetical protein
LGPGCGFPGPGLAARWGRLPPLRLPGIMILDPWGLDALPARQEAFKYPSPPLRLAGRLGPDETPPACSSFPAGPNGLVSVHSLEDLIHFLA